jgi:thiamine-phosphate pyrophosphorylase
VTGPGWRDPARLGRALRLMVLVEGPDMAAAALRGGATAIQLRHKGASARALCAAGTALQVACAAHGALFIVNDRLDVALACGADGVHLGQDDIPAERARRIGGAGVIIGVSAATPDEARAAARDGADYLGVGSVHATTTKADAGAPIGLGGLRRVVEASELPVVAIGGIGVAEAPGTLTAGASGIAVVRAVTGAADPAAATARLRAALEGRPPQA